MERFVAVLVMVLWSAIAGAQSFTYYPPGNLLPKTGSRNLSTGKSDYAVHVPGMLFPLEEGGFPNSQVYSPGGSGYVDTDGKGQCDIRNYTFPWRDNFCEKRDDLNHDTPLCPTGHAHEGQDIRPKTCVANAYVAVAAEDMVVQKVYVGVVVLRASGNDSFYEYLHMSDTGTVGDMKMEIKLKRLQKVKRGQPLGFVSSIMGGVENGTTRHLHFGIKQKVRDGKGGFLFKGEYVYVSPYMSLVRAYEAKFGVTGTMLPTPVVCQPRSTRCVAASGIYTKAALVTCNSDGTEEALTWCDGATCSSDATGCFGSSSSTPPSDLAISTPRDMSAPMVSDLSTTCDPRACLCGCNGSSCRNQLCSPLSAYCTTATTLIECSGDGCSSLTKSCGYGCTGNRCNDPPGTVDMSVPPSSTDMSLPPPKTEICNGLDDDSNGIIDDPSSCWQWVTRFKDPITGARCYGIGNIPPFACSAYDREFVLFAVPTTQWSDGSNALWVQCSRGIDHVITRKGATEHLSLEALGWNCSLELGYFFNLGAGSRTPKKTPYANTCSLYRQRFATSGAQSHFFTPFMESIGGAICESPARADVLTMSGCGVPPGC